MRISFVWKQFHLAVVGMASTTGTLHERLVKAYTNSLIQLQPVDIPGSLKKQFQRITRVLSNMAQTGTSGGHLEDVIDAKSAREVAKEVVRLYDRITRLEDKEKSKASKR